MTLQDEVEFPSAFVRNVDGCKILELVRNENDPRVDVTFEEEAFPEHTPNLLADFSSRGPGPNLEIKPEITAPGVDIYSSVTGGGWATFSGTSMASPHTAGSAALIAALDPAWFGDDQDARNGTDVRRMRSALVNSADLDVAVREVTAFDEGACVHELDADDPGPMGRGNGLLQVGDATETELLAAPATVSFGELASRGPDFRTTEERQLAIENASDEPVALDVTIEGQSDHEPNVTVTPADVTLEAGEAVTLTLTADGSGQVESTYWGQALVEDDDGIVMTVPFWYRVSR